MDVPFRALLRPGYVPPRPGTLSFGSFYEHHFGRWHGGRSRQERRTVEIPVASRPVVVDDGESSDEQPEISMELTPEAVAFLKRSEERRRQRTHFATLSQISLTFPPRGGRSSP